MSMSQTPRLLRWQYPADIHLYPDWLHQSYWDATTRLPLHSQAPITQASGRVDILPQHCIKVQPSDSKTNATLPHLDMFSIGDQGDSIINPPLQDSLRDITDTDCNGNTTNKLPQQNHIGSKVEPPRSDCNDNDSGDTDCVPMRWVVLPGSNTLHLVSNVPHPEAHHPTTDKISGGDSNDRATGTMATTPGLMAVRRPLFDSQMRHHQCEASPYQPLRRSARLCKKKELAKTNSQIRS